MSRDDDKYDSNAVEYFLYGKGSSPSWDRWTTNFALSLFGGLIGSFVGAFLAYQYLNNYYHHRLVSCQCGGLAAIIGFIGGGLIGIPIGALIAGLFHGKKEDRWWMFIVVSFVVSLFAALIIVMEAVPN